MRQLFGALAVLTLTLCPAAGKKSSPRTSDPGFQRKLSKDERILQALDRLTFGPRPGDVDRVRKLGLNKWVDRQLHPERIPEPPDLDARLRAFESIALSPAELSRRYPTPELIRAIAAGREPLPADPLLRAIVARFSGGPETLRFLETVLPPAAAQDLRSGTAAAKQRVLSSLAGRELDEALIAMPRPMRQRLLEIAPEPVRRKIILLNTPQQLIAYDLASAKLMRAVYSERQLQEVLTDFWYNHFNIFLDKGADRILVPAYERESIRPLALGGFRDLLEATAKSPAMLFYLDNWQSVAARAQTANPRRRGLNENYARELLELHTMGVDGGYTQQDVIEVARCFTGWTLRAPQKGGEFEYNDRMHDKGQKIVLGHVIPAGGGIGDGETVLDILARHPSTARFISLCLARRFVADNPPPALLDRMSGTFLSTGGDLRAVMKTMLSKEFWSQGAYRAKVKTPFEMVASSLRALDAHIENTAAVLRILTNLGQPLYRKLEPSGYSLLNADWINSASLLGRMNFGLALAQNKVPGVSVSSARFAGSPDAVDIARGLLFRDVAPETVAALRKAAREQASEPHPALLAGLVIGSPEFQRK